MPTMDADVVTESNRPWQCIVWDDQVNSMSYVTYVFQMLFGMDSRGTQRVFVRVQQDAVLIIVARTSVRFERQNIGTDYTLQVKVLRLVCLGQRTGTLIHT